MIRSTSTFASRAPATFLGAVLATLPGCGTQGTTALGCDSLGASKDAQKVRSFIDTASRFEADASALEGQVEAVCASMATDLGIDVPAPAEDELPVEATCGAVQAEIRAIVDAALPSGASLTVDYKPAVCSVDVGAYADCVAECDADFDAEATVECTEGRLVGGCSGMCSGECRVEGEVACEAECRGTCSGTCSGTCTGACEGTCSAMDEEGNCVGTCDGTCMGTCSASCSGTCEGTCVTNVSGSCEGSCAGTCDVELQEPRCEGTADVSADVDCEAACEASVNVRAECTEPSVSISTDAEVNEEAQARLATLMRVLYEHYPRFLGLTAQVENVTASGADLVEAFDGAAAAADRLGVRVTACFADATRVVIQAVSTVEVTLSVTVEVNASVSATAE